MHAKQTKNEMHARNVTTTSNLTQASSISTTDAGNSTITAKQAAPTGDSNWLDWLIRNNAPIGSGGQAGVAQPSPNPQMTANPQPSLNPQQPANPKGSANSSQSVQQVLNLVNKERTNAGLKSLSLNSELSKMAMAKAKDMYDNNYFDHQSPTYGSPFDMMKAFGISYRSAGENIAKGQKSAEEVMNQWMNSPGHRANILNSSFTEIGIATYNTEWVQEFIGL
ncbi:CAP domain-containing protein [Paenibacillus sp.]|uniref:CAP domain-containing protein n=1 Tax=Paenibacillus sp. TaxID=58172 RepID=UPI0028AB70AD|nr:CAP domain-containing protein [Paenibacillus sp.]